MLQGPFISSLREEWVTVKLEELWPTGITHHQWQNGQKGDFCLLLHWSSLLILRAFSYLRAARLLWKLQKQPAFLPHDQWCHLGRPCPTHASLPDDGPGHKHPMCLAIRSLSQCHPLFGNPSFWMYPELLCLCMTGRETCNKAKIDCPVIAMIPQTLKGICNLGLIMWPNARSSVAIDFQ